MDYEDLRVGIDIGTSKTIVIIVQKDEIEDKLLVLGLGQAENAGLRRGKILNIDSTIQSIKKAAEMASLMAGISFQKVNVNIPGELESINSQGIVGVARKDREVSLKDVERVLETAKHMNIGHDKAILHIFPQYFKLDEQDNIKDPIGMTGLRLEGKIHMVLSQKLNIQNIVKCVNRAGFSTRLGLATAFASANAVLTEEDKDAGVLLLDIGAGTTDIIAFLDGYPVITSVIMLGGSNFTKDLSIGLKISEGIAENIKKRYGCVYSDLVDPLEEIEVPVYSSKNHVERFSKQRVNAILEPRAEEIFILVKKKIEEKGYNLDSFGAGCVITGGCAKLSGMIELCEKILGIPARIGIPQKVSGIIDEIEDPAYATAIGVCLGEKNIFEQNTDENKSSLLNNKSEGVMKKIKSFFEELF